MTRDSTFPGILLMLAFCVLAPLLDASSKLATETIPVGQITTARFVVQAGLMLPVALAMRLSWGLSGRMAAMVAVRAVLLIGSSYAFISAVQVMAIADALAIVFVEPFILLVLGHLIFGDRIGPRRIAASAVGFVGAMLVIQPSLAAFGLVALYPLATAFLFAGYMLITRAMKGLHPVISQLHTAIAASAICVPAIWFLDGSGLTVLDPVMPQGLAWLWLFGVGFWAAVSHLCMTAALRYAPASTLAPIHYLELVAAVAIGYAVFGDFPNALSWTGIALIVASGLYIIYRERVTATPIREELPEAL